LLLLRRRLRRAVLFVAFATRVLAMPGVVGAIGSAFAARAGFAGSVIFLVHALAIVLGAALMHRRHVVSGVHAAAQSQGDC
jgi:hypothetical protein